MALRFCSIFCFCFCFIMLNISECNSLGSRKFSCEKVTSCQCERQDSMGIDLSFLPSLTVRLSIQQENATCWYHPCTDFPVTGDLNGSVYCYYENQNVTASHNVSDKDVYLLEKSEDIDFKTDESNSDIQIIFSHGKNKTVINLVCAGSMDSPSNFQFTSSSKDAFNPVFHLESSSACLRLLSSESHYVSSGVIIPVIFVALLLLYFVGGMLVLRFIRGARGTEIIPNYEFWITLPSHLKAISLYVVTCGGRGWNSYEQI